MECCILLRRLSMVECPSRIPYVRASLLLAKRPGQTTRSDLQVRTRLLPPPLRRHIHPNNQNQRNWVNMIPCVSVLLDESVEMSSAPQEQPAPPSAVRRQVHFHAPVPHPPMPSTQSLNGAGPLPSQAR